MTDKLSLYNEALLLIGERKLASLSENREPRRALDDVWDSGVAYCLESGLWHFAVRTIELANDASVEPSFGYQFGYRKPDDWVRTAGTGIDATFNSPLTQITDEAGYWWGNLTTVYIRYVSNDSAYGGDLSRWPASFAKFVATHLAAEICERITQNASKVEMLRKLEGKRRAEAKSKDAQNEGARFLPLGSWVMARGSGWGGRNDRGYGPLS